ncbi:carbohydrate ABC transporter permease [Microbacterium invictum]|uniref:Carbohydrate ABC transporter permease n=1 Tax=Microbacterium invictum TaxID=515415 RepID=A0ABZ0VAN3_9MICO|nr:carbohydrate ABC transporter permease [Microbacterium invictum]WQB70693.1 carbohydrate ABC transporter permease [Microbacterium invictum]
MITPFIWMLLASLQTSTSAMQESIIPSGFRWQNYVEAWGEANFDIYVLNSVILAVAHTVGTVIMCSMAGYALASLPFRGARITFLLTIAMLSIPTYVVVIPQFLIVKMIPLAGGNDILGQGGSGWLDTWWALIIPPLAAPFFTFLFRQFYLALPKELAEAARIDGVGEFGIYLRIMTPLIKPAIAVVAVMQVQWSWNSFLWPLLVTRSEGLRVIQVGLSSFQSEAGVQWPLLMAGATIAIVPMVLLFLVAQRYFVEGLAGSVK